MIKTTLLDVALGTGNVEDVSWEEVEAGLEQFFFSPSVLLGILDRCTLGHFRIVMDKLRPFGITTMEAAVLKKIVNFDLLVRDAFWILSQKHCPLGVARIALRKGIFGGRSLPLDRFFTTCRILKANRLAFAKQADDFKRFSRPPVTAFLPFYALGEPLPERTLLTASPSLTFGAIFREDAGEIFGPAGSFRILQRALLQCVTPRVSGAQHKELQLASRRVPVVVVVCAVIAGHPTIPADIKTALLISLNPAADTFVSLDNLIQLNIVPREMFYFEDLRIHCKLSKEVINRLQK